MKKIILVFFLAFVFIPEKTFSLTYEKHNVVSDIGDVGKGNTEAEGYFSYQVNEYPVCKKLNVTLNFLRQGIRIHYDPNKKIYAFEKGIFDCSNAWEKNYALSGIYEGMIEYLTRDTIVIYYKHENDKSHGYMKQRNIWYTFTHDEKFLFNDSRSLTQKNLASADEIKHGERLLDFYNNLDVSSSSAKIYDGVINKNIHLNKKTTSERKAPQSIDPKETQKNKDNVANELEKLEKLFKRGAITKDEYQKAKNKILN
jgi:hypothetical protein